MIAGDPGFWIRALTGQLLGKAGSIEPEVMEDYIRCFRDPGTIAASCADFRSGQSIDLVHDEQSIAARKKLRCPVLVLWGTLGLASDPSYDPVGIWRRYASDVRGKALPAGHFVPEEAPDLATAALREFFG